jgi:hypothetical protein
MADKIVDKKLANEFGKDYVKIMVGLLKGNKPFAKVASGSLINSINYRLQDTANGIQIILLANDYLQWVDKGRRPGTYPPIRAIQRWVAIKGMKPEAAWAIRQNIYKFGIKPTNVIKKTMNIIDSTRDANRKYEQRTVDNIVKMLEKNWKSSPDYIRLQSNQNN